MKYKWFTAAFLSLCLIPAAGMLVLPEQQAAGNEHLTPKPSLRNAQTGWNEDFLGDLTDYVADHFGFRQELVTANAALQTRLLCTSPAEDVIYGTDGWLYYAKTLDDYQNHATLTESEAQQLAQKVLEAAGVKVKEDKEKLKTGALFFISPGQIQALAEIALQPEDGKLDKAACQAALKTLPTVDLALFGRMVADDPCLNFDAAAQVAHAISTHAVENEYDYFTAVDDCAPEDNAGAGHLGTVEFNSSTLYRYATVNVEDLRKMLGQKTPKAVRAFVDAFIRSMPTGKQNTFANWTRPDAVYVTVRKDQPINLAGAFEKPVRAGNTGYVDGSIRALVTYAQETYADFASAPVLSLAVGGGLEALAEPCSVNTLLDALEAWLQGGEEQQ